MKVDVPASADLFSGEPINGFVIGNHGSGWKLEFLVGSLVEDVNGIALVDKHFFNCVVLEFDGDDHGVILLVVDAMEIGISEGDGGHSTFVVIVCYVVNGLNVMKMLLPS